VAWVTDDEVRDALGHVPDDPSNLAWLTRATAAANDWCYRRRRSAGYHDLPDTVPDEAVRAGTILYATALYKERGAVDSFATFDTAAASLGTGGLSQVKRLLGVDRPQTDRPAV
jgi:hypothetical protein